MNTLKVTNKGNFNDTVLQSGKIERRLGLISDELPIDTLTFFVYKEVQSQGVQYLLDSNRKPLVSSDGHFLAVRRSGGQTVDDAVPGDEITVFYTYSDEDNDYPGDEVKLGQFFIETIETVNAVLYKISCYSYLGILHKSVHEGGVYSNVEALTLIDELTYPARAYGFTYTVDPDITTLNDTLSGWLPYGNCADNLLHVLFATGWVMTPAPGSVRAYILTTPGKQSATISNSNTNTGRRRIYDQGGITRLDNAETVRLVEHSFFASPADIEKTLFDNSSDTSAANNAIIVFSEPCHGDPDTGEFITTGTLTVAESGDNYAVVSGNGSLTGYAYSHSQRQIEADTNVINNGKVVSVENETLVSFTNSKNVLERLVNNQNANQLSRVKFRPIPLGTTYYYNQVGDRLTYRDASNTTRTGYINSIDYVMSGYPSINADVLLGFTPGPYGMSVDRCEVITDYSTDRWTVPTGVTELTCVLGGSGYGGTGGFNGSAGTHGTTGKGASEGNPGTPGNGGNGGNGGSAGKVFSITLQVSPGTTIDIYIGRGGGGGRANTSTSLPGDETTISYNGSTYTSANGSILDGGYSNPLTGDVFSLPGADGVHGGKGGMAEYGGGTAAQDVESYTGGLNGSTGAVYVSGGSGDESWEGLNIAEGGGGGGAALGNNGTDGSDYTYVSRNRVLAGDGGSGANATAPQNATIPGSGGNGGNGGGGGGSGGGATSANPDISDSYLAYGDGGAGGQGSNGSDGADGWVAFFWKEET